MNTSKTIPIAAVMAASMAFHIAAGAAECTDGTCPPPTGEEATYTVISPVPESAVEPIKSAPRFKSLDGKTIALVGGSFMANVTHPELKRLILAEWPTAKVYVLGEIGSAGTYPRPGVVRREKDEFQRKLKDFKVDAVVSDPVELTPEYLAIRYELEEKIDDALEHERGYYDYCKEYWMAKRMILRSDYGIRWKSPATLNPTMEFH